MRILFLTLFLLALPACTSVQRASAPQDPRTVTIFSGATGDTVEWNALVSDAASADEVVLGENHGHPLGLSVAAAIFDDLLARTDHAALSLEFFERDEQSRLDDYLSGLADEKAFKARTQRTTGNYPAGHRAMVEAAKAAKRPVIASNAPRPYVRLSRTDSYDRLRTLTPEQQRLFRIPDSLPTGRYADDFRKLMSGMPASHGKPVKETRPKTDEEREADAKAAAERIESTFRSQSLWDWTMADSIARAAADGNRPIMHIVGRFHSDHRGGLILALANLRPSDRIVTISIVDATSASLREEDTGRADYVIYVGPAPDSKSR